MSFGERLSDIVFHPTKLLPRNADRHQVSAAFKILTSSEVALVFLIVLWLPNQFRFVPQALASRIERHSVPNLRGINFGGKFNLRGLKLTRHKSALEVDIIWQSLASENLDYINAVQLLDTKGRVISSHDYLQDSLRRSVKEGSIWQDKIYFNEAQLRNAANLGLSLYEANTKETLKIAEAITEGARCDWESRRLLISIK